MWRGTLWLAAVVIAATTANVYTGVITVENIPISLDETTTDDRNGQNSDGNEEAIDIVTPITSTESDDKDESTPSENNPPVEGTTTTGSTPDDVTGSTPGEENENEPTECTPGEENENDPTECTPGGGNEDDPTECPPGGGNEDDPTECPPGGGNENDPTESPPGGGNENDPTECPPGGGNENDPTECTPGEGNESDPTEYPPCGGNDNDPTECPPGGGNENDPTESPPGGGTTTTGSTPDDLTGSTPGEENENESTECTPGEENENDPTDCPPGGGNENDPTESPPDGGNENDPTECLPGGENENDPNECPPGEENEGTTTISPNKELIVTTKSGPVQGFKWQDKEDIISYIDIPYGTFNTNLFQAANATESWKLHSVKDHDKRCPQIQDNKLVGHLDCLTLSIFKPLIADNASVLFYIHGDDFKTGSGDPSKYGPDYLVTNGIILVLPNYRLGVLGFLCMQNKTAPGNIALKDLSLALNWTHDNIQAFGGNPDNIVVSGDGRSGALAELLALSPRSKNYVDKVITESGSLLSHWALDRDPKSKVADLMGKILEAKESIESRIDISLNDLDLSAIVDAANEISFKPCLEEEDDDAFMTETPYTMITSKKIETTFLMGSAIYAGLHEALYHSKDSIKELNEDFTLLLPDDLSFPTLTLKEETGGRVKRQYFGDHNITLDDVRNISMYFTDVGYLSPGIRSARLLTEAGATVYFYEFSFVGKFNRELEFLNRSVEGAVKGDIVGYLFTQHDHVPDEEDTEEIKMVEMLTEMWINFLTTGHPGTEKIKWTKLENVNHEEEEWLQIDSEPSLQKGLHVDRLPLWTNIYEEHFIDGGNHARSLSSSVFKVLIFQLVFWLVFCRNVSHVV